MSKNPIIPGKTKVTVCCLLFFFLTLPTHKKKRKWHHMNKYRNIASIFLNVKIINCINQLGRNITRK